MKRVFLILILIGLSLNGWGAARAQVDQPTTRAPQFTDTWAVQLSPGTDPATIATEFNMVLIGPVAHLPDLYVFRGDALTTEQVGANLRTSPQVIAYQQQIIVPGRVYADPTTEPLFGDQWHLRNTGQTGGLAGVDANVTGAWVQGFTGAGVNVGVIDEGVEFFHPDLAPNYNQAGTYDFVDNDTDPRPTSSLENHGVPVAGTIAAAVDGSCGVGVAYESGFSVLRQGLTFSDATGANIVSYARDLNAIYNGSFSWGPLLTRGADFEPLLFAAIADNVQNGRGGLGNIYVFAAGNSGTGGPDGLGENANRTGYNSSRYTIAVAASTDLGVRNADSEFGTSVFVNAPSDGGIAGITTTDRLGGGGFNGFGDCTDQFGDTSASAAIVSGTAALMLDANPGLNWRDVQYILAETATHNDPLNASWSVNEAGYPVSMLYGFGRVNAGAATTLAADWATVPDETTITSGDISVGMDIPEDGSTLSQSVHVDAALVLEHVEVHVDIDHFSPGDVTIHLTAPSGTVSPLMTLRSANTFADDPTFGWDGYDDLTLMSVHHWAENAAGTWTLDVRDERGNAVTGVLNSWSLTLHGLPAATNDINPTVILDAVILNAPFTDSVNTITASRSIDGFAPTCGTDAGYRSVWYIYEPGNSGLLTVDTAGSDYDTVLAVYDGNGGITEIVCDDDSGPDNTSRLAEVPLQGNSRYYIQVSGDNRAFGALTFNAAFTPATTAPGPFTLSTPADDVTFGVTLLPSALTWTAAANADTYTLRLNRDGEQILNITGITGTSYTFTAQQRNQLFTGAYTWQVTAVNEQGTTNASNGPFAFRIDTGEGLVRINPVPNSTIATRSETLIWTEAPGATRYRVVLVRNRTNRFDQTRDAAAICADGICTLEVAGPLLNGVHTWWIRPGTDDANGAWDSSYFAVEIQPDSTLVKRISPEPFAVLTTPPFTLSWEPIPGMTFYRVFLSDGNRTLINEWYPVAEVCGQTACAIAAPDTLTNGTYSWWMAAYDTATRSYNETLFTLAVPSPRTVLANPAPTGTLTTATDTIRFDRDPNALWYRVVIRGPVNVDQWYRARAICAETTCTAILPETLRNGANYRLWLAAWGPGGRGPATSTPYTFNLQVPTPTALTNPSPATGTTVTGDTVTFTWDDDPRAAWYHLFIRDDAGNRIHRQWYRAPLVCGGAACKVDVMLPTTGDYTWWIGSWGPGGRGPYNVDNVTGYTLTVE